jgi:hypothetical protein
MQNLKKIKGSIKDFIKGINIKSFVILIILLLASIFFIQGMPSQELFLTKTDASQVFNVYLLPSFDTIPYSRVNNVFFYVSRVLGITLNLDWYKVCLTNETKPELTIMKLVLPLQRNVDLTEIYSFKDEISFIEKNLSTERKIIPDWLVAKPNTTSCASIFLSDRGILYSGLSFYSSSTPVGITVQDEQKNFLTLNGQKVELGNSKFEIKTDTTALIIKRVIFFFALCAFWLLIVNVIKLIWKKK